MPMQLDAASPGTCGYGQDVVMAMPIPAHAPFMTPGDAAQPCQPRVVPPRARGPSKRVFDPEASDGTPKQARVEAEPRPPQATPPAADLPPARPPLTPVQPEAAPARTAAASGSDGARGAGPSPAAAGGAQSPADSAPAEEKGSVAAAEGFPAQDPLPRRRVARAASVD